MSKKSKAIRLGIDFGTTRTVVAAVENGNYPVCSFSWEDEVKEYIPTLAAVDRGKLLFGWEAAKRLQDPEVRVLRSLKRLLGRVRPDDLLELAPGFSLPAVELVTLFLAHVKEMLFRHSPLNLPKGRPLEVLAAVPANAGSNQRFITLEAFRRAGFRVRGLMNEPSAAAVEFVHRYLSDLGPKSPKKYLVVYDLGGGTFDTSVVGFAGSLFDVITHQGINRLGGDDFDQIILERALEELGLSREELPSGHRTPTAGGMSGTQGGPEAQHAEDDGGARPGGRRGAVPYPGDQGDLRPLSAPDRAQPGDGSQGHG